MISDCKEGKIDLILTKSIEMFGRNTVDTLQTIQLLRSLDVDLLFEIQNIRISENVNLIFNLYLEGHSLLSIIRYLEGNNILTPTRKKKWHKCRLALEEVLTPSRTLVEFI